MSSQDKTLNRDIQSSAGCMICGEKRLEEILNLGHMPIANHYLPIDQKSGNEKRYPLILNWCNTCSLLQLHDSLAPELLFEDYAYLSSQSLPSVLHFSETSRILSAKYLSGNEDLIIEIGSNDGVFLKNLMPCYRVLGIDCASNVCDLARIQGINVINAFVDERRGISIRNEYGAAKLIYAANVMAHVDNLHDFMLSINYMLDDNGVLIVEVPHVLNMLKDLSFDQIYHEHLCYFSLRNLDQICKQNSMKLFDVEKISTHGGSLRIHISKDKNRKYQVQPAVKKMLKKEYDFGLQQAKPYKDFALKVTCSQKFLLQLLRKHNKAGKRIVGYGAPAKATTLLNACGVMYPIIDYIIDTSPTKIGCNVPGTNIPIFSHEALRENPPDLVLILAWNYADYIMETESDLSSNGVRFIMPFPQPHIV